MINISNEIDITITIPPQQKNNHTHNNNSSKKQTNLVEKFIKLTSLSHAMQKRSWFIKPNRNGHTCQITANEIFQSFQKTFTISLS